MGITDRVILTLYTIVMAAIAVVLILITLGILPVDYFISEIAALPGNWEYAAGGAVILLISVRLLMAGIGLRGDDSTLTLADADTGKTVVSKRALEDYIADMTMEDKDTIDARIKASLEPGVNMFEITEEVKDNVKETIKKVVGLEVKNIEMKFKKIKSNGKEKV